MARSVVDPRLPRPRFDTPDRGPALVHLHDLLEQEVLTPVVARRFPLEEAAEAIAMLASERAVGRIVIVP